MYMKLKAELSGCALKDVYTNVGVSLRVCTWKKERIHVGVPLKPYINMWMCFRTSIYEIRVGLWGVSSDKAVCT